MRKHEYSRDTAEQIPKEIGIAANARGLVGLFPVRFPRHPQKRYDITLCQPEVVASLVLSYGRWRRFSDACKKLSASCGLISCIHEWTLLSRRGRPAGTSFAFSHSCISRR